jgi:type II secretion system protein C
MKHPFWIANSLLLLLLIAVLLLMYFSRTPIPEREDIQPSIHVPRKKEETLTINISKIYEQDLFGTYYKEAEPIETIKIPLLPEPPQPQPMIIPKLPEPQFIDPLNVVLKGIVVISTQESKNRAIIEDNQTKKEVIYKVGDMIEDAQIIRIFNNKVILLRSNGQQEVLYLREQDAKLDPAYAMIHGWNNVVQEVGTNHYRVNKEILLERVHNLAQFIDLLGLTTAYQNGQSIGCQVSEADNNSLGKAFGLHMADVILSINRISTASTQDRLKIYQTMLSMQDQGEITATIMRNGREFTITITVREGKPEEIQKQQPTQTPPAQKPTREDLKSMHKKYNFAPTVEELRKREKQRMLEQGQTPHVPMPTKEEVQQ